jgi:ATP-binding cassette subfamily C protein CydC
MRDLFRILRLWRSQGDALLLGAAIALASLAAGISVQALGGAALGGAAVMAVLRLLGPLRVALRYIERLTTHDATFRALADLRVWLFRGIARGAAWGIGFRRSGDLLARLVSDIDILDGVYLRILIPLLGALVIWPVLVWRAWDVDLHLAVSLGVLFALAAFAGPIVAARGAMRLGGRRAEAGAALRVAALDLLSGLREVRVFGAEGRMRATIQAREATLHGAEHGIASVAANASAMALLSGQAALLAVLIAISATGHTPTALLLLFLTLAAFEVTGGLARAGASLGQAARASSRLLEAVDTASPAEPANPASPAGFALRFEGVTFRWAADRPPVFDGLTLEIPQGTRVALLGPSGVGKSSLAALALRAAEPEAGHIMLGGVDIARIPTAELRANIGYLSQATHLFADTVRNNLLLGRPDATEEELWQALETARIDEMVRGLPDGLDAWVGEGGAGFSGGQGRRLALARTLLSRAPILILDEPCAGLDADTERAFLSTLNEVAVGRTVVLIAHRLVGIERLDRVWRLSAGHAMAAMG